MAMVAGPKEATFRELRAIDKVLKVYGKLHEPHEL
jgi:hypothetical protein